MEHGLAEVTPGFRRDSKHGPVVALGMRWRSTTTPLAPIVVYGTSAPDALDLLQDGGAAGFRTP